MSTITTCNKQVLSDGRMPISLAADSAVRHLFRNFFTPTQQKTTNSHNNEIFKAKKSIFLLQFLFAFSLESWWWFPVRFVA